MQEETQLLEVTMPTGEVQYKEIPIDQETLQQSFIRVKAQIAINPTYQGCFLDPPTDGKAHYSYIGSLAKLLEHYHAWGFEGDIPDLQD